MDPLTAVLTGLGINIAAQLIYDFAKTKINAGDQSSETLAADLATEFPELKVEGARVVADTVVDVFAEHGLIEIRGSYIYAGDAVWMRSAPGTAFTFGHGSTSATDRTRIDAGPEAEMRGTGGAEVRQNDDGSITFHT